MKKLLSLTLIVILVMTTLVGCDGCQRKKGNKGNGEIPADAVEITDTYEELADVWGTYNAETGWTGDYANFYRFFRVGLNDGDVVYFEFSAETHFKVYIVGDPNATWQTGNSFIVDGSGLYMVTTDNDVSTKIYVLSANA